MKSFINSNKVKIGLISVTLFILSAQIFYYRHHYQAAVQQKNILENLAERRLSTLNNLKKQQHKIAEMDEKYYKELQHAQMENTRLHHDIAIGYRQLRLKNTPSLPDTAAITRVGDGTTTPLSREMGSRIFNLRSGIIQDHKKLIFLQEYIKKYIHENENENENE